MGKDYLYYKTKLIKSTNGEGKSILPIIKRNFGPLGYSDSLRAIIHNINYIDYFKCELCPQNINDIITYDYIPLSFDGEHITEKNIVNEILCYMALFSHFQQKLAIFKKYRHNFEYFLLDGSYDFAKKQLDKIQGDFGLSFWLIESQFLLFNNYLGIVDSEKAYQEIKNQCSDYYIKNFIRSLRRKTNTREDIKDSIAFLQKKQKDFSAKSVGIHKQAYYGYNYNQISDLSYDTIYNLLVMASQLNLVDMFLLIDKIIVDLVCSNNISSQSKHDMFSAISHYDLPFSCKKSADLLYGRVDWCDSLTKAIYNEKSDICKYALKEYSRDKAPAIKMFPNIFEVIVNYCKMDLLCPQNEVFNNNLLNDLVFTIKYSIVKSGDYNLFLSTTSNAIRLTLSLSSTTLCYGICNFYQDIFNADTSQNIKDVVTSSYYNRNIFCLFENKPQEDIFNERFGFGESNWYHGWNRKEDLIYDTISLQLNSLEHYPDNLDIRHNSLQKEQTIIAEIIDNRCTEQLFLHYTKTNNISAAIKLYVELQFQSKLKVTSFDIARINKKCTAMKLRDLYPDINFCLYAHLTNFRGAAGLRFNIQAANSVLAILKANNASYPSQLSASCIDTVLQRKKYAYLFRHVCEEDLLTSILIGYSISEDDDVVRMKKILEERENVLCLSLDLDEKAEQSQIKSQILKVQKKKNSIENFYLEDTLLTNAKILLDSILVSQNDTILPFFQNICEILRSHASYNFADISSGEYLLFKDSFIKFKKAYLQSLDRQIGINIRHGFFKHTILNYFSMYGLAVEFNSSKNSDNSISLNEKLTDSPEKRYLVPYIENIRTFSKELCNFIDSILANLKIKHSSIDCENVFSIYLPDKEISKVAIQIIGSTNPYEFEEKLHLQMASLINNNLRAIGSSIEDTINAGCIEIIDNCFANIPNSDILMTETISKLKAGVPQLSNQIREWFKFVNQGEAMCSLSKYSQVIDKRGWEINLSMSDNLPEEIKFKQLHCIDLIFSNLIMNAEEHSGLSKSQLQIATSLSTEKNIMKIYFRNNLSAKSKTDIILSKMLDLEKTIKQIPQPIHSNKGNGFYYLADVLNSVTKSWTFSFCQEELPKYFALNFKIDWGMNSD